MARLKVTGPDGKSYIVNAPDGASDADIVEFVQTQMGSGVPGQSIGSTGFKYGPDPRMIGAEGQANGETVDMAAWSPEMKARFEKMRPKNYEAAVAERFRSNLIPWQDEIVGGLAAGGQYVGQMFDDAPDKGISDLYGENTAILRAVKEDARSKGEGFIGGGAELAGGLLIPGGAAKSVASGNLLKSMARGAKYGAGYGALWGSGEGDDSNRIEKGLEGAGYGVIGGAAIPVAASAIGKAFSGAAKVPGKVASRLRGTSAEDDALARIASTIEDARINTPTSSRPMDIDDVRRQIQEASAAGERRRCPSAGLRSAC